MNGLLLIKYSEIGIKGKNRYVFEDMLVSNIKAALKRVGQCFEVRKANGRIYVGYSEDDFDETIAALSKVFGIAGICPVKQIQKCDFNTLKVAVLEYFDETYSDKNLTFKVNCRRADKAYPLDSVEINMKLGEAILETYPETAVDVHNPDVLLTVEIRPLDINIYSKVIPGPCGMPVGSSGRVTLLLSGGIDSPVAGYLMAKRGAAVDAVYFHAPPYTSERAKQKVVDLAKIVSRYSGPIRLYVVNFTDIQMAIYEKCPHDELTIIMRRYMMRIAEHFAKERGTFGLVTGESIGQVASQTMQSLICTNEVCTLPVYRPLCGFDKSEIIALSEKIDAYETSILPYEDCCTIFVAKHPVTKPKTDFIRHSEERLKDVIGVLLDKALSTAEIIEINWSVNV